MAKNYLSSGSLKPALDALLGALETDPNNIEANSLAGATLMALNEYTSAEALLYSAVKLSAWSDYLSMANLAECLRINGDLEMAEKVAFKALKSPAADRDPSGILAYTLGNLFLSKHKYAEAADWLLSSAVKQSNNVDLWIKASTLMFPPENRDFKFAANVLSEANSRNPSNSQILVYLGIALSETGRLADGVALVEESYRLDNTNTLASSLLKTVSRV